MDPAKSCIPTSAATNMRMAVRHRKDPSAWLARRVEAANACSPGNDFMILMMRNTRHTRSTCTPCFTEGANTQTSGSDTDPKTKASALAKSWRPAADVLVPPSWIVSRPAPNWISGMQLVYDGRRGGARNSGPGGGSLGSYCKHRIQQTN